METLISASFSAKGKPLSLASAAAQCFCPGLQSEQRELGSMRRQLPLPSSRRPQWSWKTIQMRITVNLVAMLRSLIHNESTLKAQAKPGVHWLFLEFELPENSAGARGLLLISDLI